MAVKLTNKRQSSRHSSLRQALFSQTMLQYLSPILPFYRSVQEQVVCTHAPVGEDAPGEVPARLEAGRALPRPRLLRPAAAATSPPAPPPRRVVLAEQQQRTCASQRDLSLVNQCHSPHPKRSHAANVSQHENFVRIALFAHNGTETPCSTQEDTKALLGLVLSAWTTEGSSPLRVVKVLGRKISWLFLGVQ